MRFLVLLIAVWLTANVNGRAAWADGNDAFLRDRKRQVQKALEIENPKERERLAVEIFATAMKPAKKGLTGKESHDLDCAIDAVLAPLYESNPPFELLLFNRLLALSHDDADPEDRQMLKNLSSCPLGTDDPIAKMYLASLKWANNLKASTPEEIRKAAKEYELLLRSPDTPKSAAGAPYLYKAIHLALLSLADDRQAELAPQPAKETEKERMDRRLALWKRAKNGDIGSQLALAKSYESEGSQKADLKAYYWYMHAERERADSTATKGRQRLEERLSAFDKRTAKRWLDKNLPATP